MVSNCILRPICWAQKETVIIISVPKSLIKYLNSFPNVAWNRKLHKKRVFMLSVSRCNFFKKCMTQSKGNENPSFMKWWKCCPFWDFVMLNEAEICWGVSALLCGAIVYFIIALSSLVFPFHWLLASSSKSWEDKA